MYTFLVYVGLIIFLLLAVLFIRNWVRRNIKKNRSLFQLQLEQARSAAYSLGKAEGEAKAAEARSAGVAEGIAQAAAELESAQAAELKERMKNGVVATVFFNLDLLAVLKLRRAQMLTGAESVQAVLNDATEFYLRTVDLYEKGLRLILVKGVEGEEDKWQPLKLVDFPPLQRIGANVSNEEGSGDEEGKGEGKDSEGEVIFPLPQGVAESGVDKETDDKADEERGNEEDDSGDGEEENGAEDGSEGDGVGKVRN